MGHQKAPANSGYSSQRPAHHDGIAPIAGAVRILAGSTQEFIDRDGNKWGPDRYYTGGRTSAVHYRSLAYSRDPVLYRHYRYGYDFSYNIPLEKKTYEMRLYFAESSETGPILGDNGEDWRIFTITANGKLLLPNLDGRHLKRFDITADAGGPDIADVKVFKDITPGPDGFLRLHFTARKQTALVNAILLTPGESGRMLPLRWRASDTPYWDRAGQLWASDRFYSGGRLSHFGNPTRNTTDPELFSDEHFGNFTYKVPVAPGRYSVTLYFSENYHTVWDHDVGPGARLFNVYANGVTLLRGFDIFREAHGANSALVKRFRHIDSNPFDKIELHFEPVNDYAVINAIEVEDEGK